jgi:hypothetical protein
VRYSAHCVLVALTALARSKLPLQEVRVPVLAASGVLAVLLCLTLFALLGSLRADGAVTFSWCDSRARPRHRR